jgi:hypothetical protein
MRIEYEDIESARNMNRLIVRIVDGLRYHLMPYLEETFLSGLDEIHLDSLNPKVYLVYRYIELINSILLADCRLRLVRNQD